MNAYCLDYTVLDPQIIAMRRAGVKIRDIAATLGIGVSTVGKRIRILGVGKPQTQRQRAKRYCPTQDERRTLAFLLTTASSVQRRTGATSEKIISTVMELASKGKLDIKRAVI